MSHIRQSSVEDDAPLSSDGLCWWRCMCATAEHCRLPASAAAPVDDGVASSSSSSSSSSLCCEAHRRLIAMSHWLTTGDDRLTKRSISLPLSLSFYLCLSLLLPLRIPISISLYTSLALSLCVSLCIPVSVCLHLSLCLPVGLCLHLYLSLTHLYVLLFLKGFTLPSCTRAFIGLQLIHFLLSLTFSIRILCLTFLSVVYCSFNLVV